MDDILDNQYSIFVEPSDLKRLYKDIWAKESVPAVFKFNGQRYHTHFMLRGHQIRKHTKKSFDIEFLNPNYFRGAKTLHLNAESIDPSCMRNKLSMDFFKKIGVLAPDTEHVEIDINGKKRGLYLQLESFDECFLKKRGLPIGPVYYATNDDANFSLITPRNEIKKTLEAGYTRKVGDEGSINDVRQLIYTINTPSISDFPKEISKLLDIEKYFLWLAGVVVTQNFDGFIHNYALYKNMDSGLFELSPWDFDGTWGRDLKGRILEPDFVPITGYNTLSARLLAVSRFRSLYKKTIEDILNHFFSIENLEPEILKLHQKLKPSIVTDPIRNVDLFEGEKDVILNFINHRRDYLYDHLKDLN